MSDKQRYVAEMEAQLNAWRASLAMKARLDEAELEARLEFHRQVEASQHQHEVACRHLDELERSGAEAWALLREGIEAAWRDLSS